MRTILSNIGLKCKARLSGVFHCYISKYSRFVVASVASVCKQLNACCYEFNILLRGGGVLWHYGNRWNIITSNCLTQMFGISGICAQAAPKNALYVSNYACKSSRAASFPHSSPARKAHRRSGRSNRLIFCLAEIKMVVFIPISFCLWNIFPLEGRLFFCSIWNFNPTDHGFLSSYLFEFQFESFEQT